MNILVSALFGGVMLIGVASAAPMGCVNDFTLYQSGCPLPSDCTTFTRGIGMFLGG